MNYNIEISVLGSEQQLFLASLEDKLTAYIRSEMSNHKTLGVTPVWTVTERGDKFFTCEGNANFDVKDSFAMHGKIENFLKRAVSVDFNECSLHLMVKYRTIEKKEDDAKKDAKADDGLPTFLPVTPRYSFSQVILPDEVRSRIYNNLNTIKHQDLIYNVWGFSEVDSKPKSILNFFGPPGTGKTMCAHAIAKELDKPLLALNYSEIESKYVGDAAKNLKKAFDTATELGAVMFFDEADSFLGKRIENVSQGSDQALNSLRSQMLILLEDFEGVVLFATNLITNFDKAFESRILDHIKLELPNREARAEIIDKMLPAKLPLEQRFSQEQLLEASDLIDGLAGREIKGAILSMLMEKAGKEEADPKFSLDDLKTALKRKKEQVDQLKAEQDNRIKERIANKLKEKSEENKALEEMEKEKKQNRKNKRRR